MDKYFKTGDIEIHCCDNMALMQSMQSNSVDLIYCDILYGTGRRFKDYQDLKPKRSEIEAHYTPRITEMHRILKDTGSIYLQMSEEILHWVRCIMDDVFGYERFLRQIYWKRSSNTGSSKASCKTFPNSVDCIILYSKSKSFTFNRSYSSYSKKTASVFRNEDESGQYRWQSLKCYSEERYNELLSAGMLKLPQKSKYPQYKQYFKESKGVVLDNNWQDIGSVRHSDYFSEKPEELIGRIIKASSREGDLVADFYAGRFTTAKSCLDLNRRFIGCDINQNAFNLGVKRINK